MTTLLTDIRGVPLDPERVPELTSRIEGRPYDDAWVLAVLGDQATCFLDVDGEHVWFAHVCGGQWTEQMLVLGRPTGLKGNGHGWCATGTNPLIVAPSVVCDDCGFHDHHNGRFGPLPWKGARRG